MREWAGRQTPSDRGRPATRRRSPSPAFPDTGPSYRGSMSDGRRSSFRPAMAISQERSYGHVVQSSPGSPVQDDWLERYARGAERFTAGLRGA